MKILFITQYFPPETGACSNRVHELAREWVKKSVEVTVLTSFPNYPNGTIPAGYRKHMWKLLYTETIDGIRVKRVLHYPGSYRNPKTRILNYLSFMVCASVGCLFAGRKFDLAIVTSPPLFVGVVGIVAKFMKRIPLMLEIRDIWPASITSVGAMDHGLGIRCLEWLEMKLYRLSDHIVAVGKGYKQKIIEKHIRAEKIDVVYNGINADEFESAKIIPIDFRTSIQDKRPVVGYVGTIGIAHELEIILKAAMTEVGKKWIFVLIGDGAKKHEMEQEVKRGGIDNVLFTGLIPKKDIPSAIAGLDVCFIHLKKTDLFNSVIPSKMFEAMVMSKPIILGVGGEAAELLSNAGAGIVIEAENVNEFTGALKKLNEDTDLHHTMGENGHRFVNEHFDRRKLADDYLNVIKRTLRTMV